MVVSTRVSPVTVGLCIMLCLMAATVHGGEVDGMEQGDDGGHCPDGYILNDESCYRLEESSKTFTEALDTCRREGGQLVTIDSSEENDVVTELLLDARQPSTEWAWIGLTDRETEGEFRWLGSSDPPSFTDMSPVIGNDDTVDCVLITPEFGWAPLYCDGYAAFVCETSVIK
ncbi:snaclec coagulation factor IX-binding protein subunit A-like [Littorina saxatilis]|uniref:C-type lectin domain-containing protein n=1 Tax=Littorina saxatilis TaxID=31220 RepID=A0AAN9GDN9_9CAEN